MKKISQYTDSGGGNGVIDYPVNEYVVLGNRLFRKIGMQKVPVQCHWFTNKEGSCLMDQWGFTHQIDYPVNDLTTFKPSDNITI